MDSELLGENSIKEFTHSSYEIFDKIYKENQWGDGSGGGSKPKNAIEYLKILQDYFIDEKITSYYDIGCGDWQLMQKINIPSNKFYYGFDVASTVIEKNSKLFKNDQVAFTKIKNLSDLKNINGDLLIIKDVLQHLPNKEIKFFLDNILPNFKLALITNDFDKENNGLRDNIDIKIGHWRTLDLEKAPFSLGKLQTLTTYNAHGNKYKKVYLWKNSKMS